jgi:hypothetical protein
MGPGTNWETGMALLIIPNDPADFVLLIPAILGPVWLMILESYSMDAQDYSCLGISW